MQNMGRIHCVVYKEDSKWWAKGIKRTDSGESGLTVQRARPESGVVVCSTSNAGFRVLGAWKQTTKEIGVLLCTPAFLQTVLFISPNFLVSQLSHGVRTRGSRRKGCSTVVYFIKLLLCQRHNTGSLKARIIASSQIDPKAPVTSDRWVADRLEVVDLIHFTMTDSSEMSYIDYIKNNIRLVRDLITSLGLEAT